LCEPFVASFDKDAIIVNIGCGERTYSGSSSLNLDIVPGLIVDVVPYPSRRRRAGNGGGAVHPVPVALRLHERVKQRIRRQIRHGERERICSRPTLLVPAAASAATATAAIPSRQG